MRRRGRWGGRCDGSGRRGSHGRRSGSGGLLGAAALEEFLPRLAVGRACRLGRLPLVAALFHHAFGARGAGREAQSGRDEKS